MNNLPNPGSIVQVMCRSLNHYYHDPVKYVDVLYEGTVLPQNKWDNPNSFNLTTGNPEFPMRVIGMNSVIGLNYVSGSGCNIAQDESTKSFSIKGSKGDNYIVLKTGAKYTCTCVGFQFKRHCKHIQKVINEN